MVKTQAVNATEVAYLLNDFMGVHTGSQLPEILRLKGIIDVDGIASMSFAIIDKLTYKDPDDNSTQPLNSGEKQLFKMFIVYTHRLSDDDTLPEYWNNTTLDPKTFRKFRMSQEPHTRISSVYSNTDYKDAIAAVTTTTAANSTGARSIANPINVVHKELNAGIDIDDLQKTTLLQIAVQRAPSLARVKDDADILSTQLNKSLTFDEYYRLLESAAQQFDSLTERNAAGTRKAHRQTRRHDVFEHHTTPDTADDFSVLDMSYYDVMRTSQQQHQCTPPPADQRPRVRLADDQWKDLEDKARTLWKSISAPNKAIILRYSTMQHPDTQTTQQVHFITSQCLKLDAAEFMVSRAASYHLGEHPFSKDVHSKASNATWDASTMTGSVNRTNLKTGDPRKMLSNRLAKPPTGAVASPATEVTISGHVVGSFVADNDIMRFQAHNTNVMYCVSRLTHIEPGIDMVNRSANGGVAGSNMCVIFRHPTLSVDIEGYDQHCTTNIPLVTCANVVHTH
jgi:hypothetical protein